MSEIKCFPVCSISFSPRLKPPLRVDWEMSLKNLLSVMSKKKASRWIGLFLLNWLDFNISIKHPITKRKFWLNIKKHKGYWFHGAQRERDVFEQIKLHVPDQINFLEVGSHIGFVTQIFEEKAKSTGSVVALEPTPISYEYLAKNSSLDTKLLKLAASDTRGTAIFFADDFGGFTNSLCQSYTSGQNSNLARSHFRRSAKTHSLMVETDTVDNICHKLKFKPNFIKVDAEGAELAILRGATETLKHADYILIEISINKNEIIEILYNNNFNPMNHHGPNEDLGKYESLYLFKKERPTAFLC